jgi:hypothetical protein
VSLLGRKKGATDESAHEIAESDAADPTEVRRTTAPKGRPTPKRDATRRRGPVAPAPMTTAEARRRRKEVKGPKLTREERREFRNAQRKNMSDRRERMMAGDEDYLLPRDQGPVRRYVRDIVDSRRGLLGLFMPLAFALVLVSFASPPKVGVLLSPAMLVLVVIMLIDGIFLSRRVNKLVDDKFPDHTESRWRLGLYAASRASQLRRMRSPRPQINRGDPVT